MPSGPDRGTCPRLLVFPFLFGFGFVEAPFGSGRPGCPRSPPDCGPLGRYPGGPRRLTAELLAFAFGLGFDVFCLVGGPGGPLGPAGPTNRALCGGLPGLPRPDGGLARLVGGRLEVFGLLLLRRLLFGTGVVTRRLRVEVARGFLLTVVASSKTPVSRSVTESCELYLCTSV